MHGYTFFFFFGNLADVIGQVKIKAHDLPSSQQPMHGLVLKYSYELKLSEMKAHLLYLIVFLLTVKISKNLISEKISFQNKIII
jgi:hypothetical protein